jgi:uncharacterized protein
LAPTNILRADNVKPKTVAKRPASKPGANRQIVIRAGKIVVRARLLDTPTADRIWAQLPLYSTAERWGEALHFETTIETGREGTATRNLAIGDIGYWTEDDRIIIGFGMTPLSKAGEIRMPSPVNVWARALDDVTALTIVRAGERVSVLHADS